MRHLTTLLACAIGFALIQLGVLFVAGGGTLSHERLGGLLLLILGSGMAFGFVIGAVGLAVSKVFALTITNPRSFGLATTIASVGLMFALNGTAAALNGGSFNDFSVLAIIFDVTSMAPLTAIGFSELLSLCLGAGLVGLITGAAGSYVTRLVHGHKAV